jgi:hypothetical protein
LCLIFGVMPSVCSHILNHIIKLTVRCQCIHDSTKVSFQSPENMKQFALMVNNREPAISEVIGFLDGISFKSECTSERITQNASTVD